MVSYLPSSNFSRVSRIGHLIKKKVISKVLFKNEYNALTRLHEYKHPNIIQLHSSDMCTQTLYLKYFESGDLLDYYKTRVYTENPMKAEEIANIIYKITIPLEFCHEHLIIHGDIKPDNVIVTRTNDELEPILIDFGSSRSILTRDIEQKHSTYCVGTFGTDKYCAPEYHSAKISTYSDIYSLGVMFHALLFNRFPIFNNNTFELTNTEECMVPHTYINLLYDMLEFDYKSRPSAEEVRAELKSIL